MGEDFKKEVRNLRTNFKLLKAGLLKWDDIPLYYKKLLKRYYGVKLPLKTRRASTRKTKGSPFSSLFDEVSQTEKVV